jgi:type I restriction enzyme S subunit
LLDFYSKPWFISKEDHEQIYKRCDPKKGDVLYIKDGATTGIAAINNYDFEFSMLSSLALLRINADRLNSHYICYWLNNSVVKQSLLGFMSGAAIQRLTLAKIQKILVPTPPLALQEEFANRINKLEQLKANNIIALTKQNTLFATLQHQAFNGQL